MAVTATFPISHHASCFALVITCWFIGSYVKAWYDISLSGILRHKRLKSSYSLRRSAQPLLFTAAAHAEETQRAFSNRLLFIWWRMVTFRLIWSQIMYRRYRILIVTCLSATVAAATLSGCLFIGGHSRSLSKLQFSKDSFCLHIMVRE